MKVPIERNTYVVHWSKQITEHMGFNSAGFNGAIEALNFAQALYKNIDEKDKGACVKTRWKYLITKVA